jgi:hypothetical protein
MLSTLLDQGGAGALLVGPLLAPAPAPVAVGIGASLPTGLKSLLRFSSPQPTAHAAAIKTKNFAFIVILQFVEKNSLKRQPKLKPKTNLKSRLAIPHHPTSRKPFEWHPILCWFCWRFLQRLLAERYQSGDF